jgi:hypothetical protein
MNIANLSNDDSVCRNDKSENSKELEYQELIDLLGIYLNNFIHRDQILWSQTLKFFYAIIVVILLPNVSEIMGLSMPSLPSMAFRLIGIVMSFIFLYVGLAYCARMNGATDAFFNINAKLCKSHQIEGIKRLYKPRLSNLIVSVMFSALLLTATFFLIFSQ